MKDADGFKYFLSDHLGSTSVVLDASGGILEQQRYLPFGGARTDLASPLIASTDFTYTGQRNLPDTGLMDYRARFYSPALGRFIQPDTIVPNPISSQTWNRFSYAANNPILYNDPDGHCGPLCVIGIVGIFFILNSTGDAPINDGSSQTSRQTSAAIGLTLLSVANPVVEHLSNIADCATGTYCSPESLTFPGSAAAYSDVVTKTTLSAKDLRWTQDTLSWKTSDGIALDDLAEDMALNGWKGNPLQVVKYRDALWSLDNRRLAAAKLADIDVPVELYESHLNPKINKKWSAHFTTETFGLTIDVVERYNGPKLGIKLKMKGNLRFYDP